MNDKELKKAFPYGALLIPRAEDAPSSRVQVGQEWEDEDYPEYFQVWRDPFRNLFLSRELTPKHDGYEVKGENGLMYFLRPLTKEQEVKF